VLSVVISDLHLGTTSGRDVATRPAVAERMLAAIEGADQIVLLGDVLELRERPLRQVIERARPVLEPLGDAAAGRRVLLVPGNHDHQLLGDRLRGGGVLEPASTWPVSAGRDLAGTLASWMPRAEVALAYPGVFLRDDVYATHGHYLDAHLTVPRIESIAVSAVQRVVAGGRPPRSVREYEDIVAPLYDFLYRRAQGAPARAIRSQSYVSRRVWERVNGARAGGLSAFVIGRVTIPGAVAVMNRIGLGPFKPEISGAELRRAGLQAMATVLSGMGMEAPHVLFGHTHRPGPLPGDTEGWTLPSGMRLWNSGSWLYESALERGQGPSHPYWPGTVVHVGPEGEPVLSNALAHVELAVR
jgi:Calcineurin-like phosphoesterase